MGNTLEEKLFRYVNDGRLKRVRSLLKKYKLDLSYKNAQKRTVLHVACLLGEHAIVTLLLRHGASREAKDKDGNTPLHLALQYAMQVLEKSVYDDLISPLLHPKLKIQYIPNDEGETPRQLIKKYRKELKRKWEDRKIFEEKADFKREEVLQRKEWNKKLFFELRNDDIDFAGFTEMDYGCTSSETYDEWADRIEKERCRKQYLDAKQREILFEEKIRLQKENERKARERTRTLEEQHQKYLEDVSQKRKQLWLEELKSNYELRCKEVFSENMTTKLSFSDVPWPCSGTVEEMTDLISKWTWNEDRKKYLKAQQIRWHPDRFLQKCAGKLIDKDKEKILDNVKQLSQGINILLEE